MKFSQLLTPAAMAEELGERVKRARLNLNYTQEQLGKFAGVTRYIIQKIEQGTGGDIQDLMAVLIALEQVEQMDNLLPDQKISPLELYKLKGKVRERASGHVDDADKDNKEEDLGW